MAFDRQSLHIVASGQLGTGGGAGEEIFSFGFRATGVSGFDAVGALAGIDVPAIAALIGVYFNAAGLHLHQDAQLFRVKVSAVGTNGLYLTDPVEDEPAPGGVTGADAAVRHPNQVACVISTGTSTNIGRAVRGRYYLPLPADGINPDGRIDASRASGRATLAAGLFTGLNSLLEAGTGDSSNISIMSSVGAGTTHGVTRVRVGRVLDTIRSRRNQLDENYSADVVVV